MNFQAGMIPGICALAVGALLTFFSDKLCHREKNCLLYTSPSPRDTR